MTHHACNDPKCPEHSSQEEIPDFPGWTATRCLMEESWPRWKRVNMAFLALRNIYPGLSAEQIRAYEYHVRKINEEILPKPLFDDFESLPEETLKALEKEILGVCCVVDPACKLLDSFLQKN